MPKSKAFTLVELLVVIAIIALLIAILVPTLSLARELTKQLLCMTNLRSIGTGINIYAEISRDYVPGFLGEEVGQSVRYFMLAYAYVDREFQPVNLGRLHAQGVIEHPEVFYCPFPRPTKYYSGSDMLPGYSSADEYPEPWGENPLATKYQYEGPGAICSNYSYNPHLDEGLDKLRYRKTQEFPSNTIVTMDGLGSNGEDKWIVHRITTFSVNVHYIDGHAANIAWPEGLRLNHGLSGNPAHFQEILTGLEAR